jgi:hypothetical protein
LFACVCVCVCVCVRARARARACVCVCTEQRGETHAVAVRAFSLNTVGLVAETLLLWAHIGSDLPVPAA